MHLTEWCVLFDPHSVHAALLTLYSRLELWLVGALGAVVGALGTVVGALGAVVGALSAVLARWVLWLVLCGCAFSLLVLHN